MLTVILWILLLLCIGTITRWWPFFSTLNVLFTSIKEVMFSLRLFCLFDCLQNFSRYWVQIVLKVCHQIGWIISNWEYALHESADVNLLYVIWIGVNGGDWVRRVTGSQSESRKLMLRWLCVLCMVWNVLRVVKTFTSKIMCYLFIRNGMPILVKIESLPIFRV